MTAHVNQIISVIIRGDVDIDLTLLDKQIEISKDLSEEPNEAEITVYNLNTDTRSALKAAADNVTPIEIGISPLGSAEPITAFFGEIDAVSHQNTRPGYATRIRAYSQKRSHRAAYVTGKTYPKGTPKSDIVSDLVGLIALPYTLDDIPTTGLLLAQTFSGPAFVCLRRFVMDLGMYCYITDGVLRISSVYDPPSPTVVNITDAMMVSDLQETSRTDALDTVLHTVTEMTAIDPLRKQGRRKKTKKDRKELGANDYVTIEAIDTVVPGIELDCFIIPNLQPDTLITVPNSDQYFRVFEVGHSGTDYRGGEGLTTRIRADRFEGDPPVGAEPTDRNAIIAELEALG